MDNNRYSSSPQVGLILDVVLVQKALGNELLPGVGIWQSTPKRRHKFTCILQPAWCTQEYEGDVLGEVGVEVVEPLKGTLHGVGACSILKVPDAKIGDSNWQVKLQWARY